MKYKIILLGVLVAFSISSRSAQAGFGDALKKATEKIPEAPAATTAPKLEPGAPTVTPQMGKSMNPAGGAPYVTHRESLIPYTGLGNTEKTKWFANLKEAQNFLGPKHDNCFVAPVKKVENKSNYKVWPSHDETNMQCVKLLDDDLVTQPDYKQACYFVKLACKVQHPGQQEPKPGEWGTEYNRCEVEYESSYRFQGTCPTAYAQ